ncbi:MAG: hypothetical protein ABSA16_12345 [Thermoguttaceae bacterium]|jgi:hypothetical protein
MSRIWALICLSAAAGGVVLMVVSYRQAQDSCGSGDKRYVLYVAEKTEAKTEMGRPVTVFFLPARKVVDEFVKILGGTTAAAGRSFLRNHQEKVILFPDFEQQFTADMLVSGRLPKPGTTEVLADPRTTDHGPIKAGDEKLSVVGVLKKTNLLQQDAYYAADNPPQRGALDPSGKKLIGGFIVPLEDLKLIRDIKQRFPREQFTAIAGSQRLDRGAYYNYMIGMSLLLIGGSVLLIRSYMFAARRITNAWIGPPLAQISRHWKLFSLMHVIYFGICIIGALIIYEKPLPQDFLLTTISGQIESESGVLGVAGMAYGSRNIALAAVTTLVINFFVGSILVITLPSVIVPGIGVFMALFRAALWGIMMAPTSMALAGAIRFHSVTLLLEGEGYILAAFFALLMPIYLFNPAEGNKLRARYGHALMMNVKGNIIVFIMLAVAASYEAIEVILQMR